MNNDSDAGPKPSSREIERDLIALYGTIEESQRTLVRCWRGKERRDETMAKLAGQSVFPVLFVTIFLDFLGFEMVLPYLYSYAENMDGD